MTRAIARLRHRPGMALMEAAQAAVAVVVVTHALALTSVKIEALTSPTGLQEANLLVVRSQPLGAAVRPAAASQIDLQALRALPGVEAASLVNFLPLDNRGWRTTVRAVDTDGQRGAQHHVSLMIGDSHLLATYGLELIAGRGFAAEQVTVVSGLGNFPPVAMLSKALATTLFGAADPLGRSVDIGHRTVRIIGVVERAQSAWAGWPNHELTMLFPAQLEFRGAMYAVRAKPDQRGAVRTALKPALLAVNPRRLVDDARRYRQIRAQAYATEVAQSVWLIVMSLALCLVTGFGLYGLGIQNSRQRRREIAVRRALGAPAGLANSGIAGMLIGERALASGAGIALGVIGTAATASMPGIKMAPATLTGWLLIACALVALVSLCATLGPAHRAARADPARVLRAE